MPQTYNNETKQKATLTQGNLWKAMFLFSIPLIFTNLFQAVYSIVDMIIVGHFAGPAGLTAVGNGGQITMIVLTIVLGLANGGAVIVSQLLGAKRGKDISDTLGTMCMTFLAIGAVVTILLLILSESVLHALNTPPEAFDEALRYLRICLVGTIPIYLYNMMAALLRGVGNSGIPLILVGTTTVLNLLLDWLFVGVLSMNATGAAIATLISQVVCAILIFPMTFRRYSILKIKKESMRIRKDVLHNLLKIGMPQSIQFTLTNISFAFILNLVNAYGNTASAVSVSVTRLSTFAVLSGQAVMGAIIAMTGQNIGAKQYKRALQGMGIGMAYGMPLAVVFFFLSELRPEMMLRLFTTDAGVLAMGAPYLQVLAVSFLIESVMFCMFGLLTGAGYTNITMLCAILSSFLVRYALAVIFSRVVGLGFIGIAWAYPFAPMCSCIVCIIFILSGRWKKSRLGQIR